RSRPQRQPRKGGGAPQGGRQGNPQGQRVQGGDAQGQGAAANRKRRPKRPANPQPGGEGQAAAAPQGPVVEGGAEGKPAGNKSRNRRRRSGPRKKPESSDSSL